MEQQVHGEPKVCLGLLCGLPAAGKTSLTEALVKKIGHPDFVHGENSTLASEDESVLGLGGSVVSPWKVYRQEILRCVDVLLGRLKSNKPLDGGTTVMDDLQDVSQIGKEVWSKVLNLIPYQIKAQNESSQRNSSPTSSVILFIDDNMYFRSMRYEYYRLAKKHNTGFCQIYLKCDTKTAVARNSQRLQGIPEKAIWRMAGRIEAPDEQVASWEKNNIHISSDDLENETTLSAIWELITKAFEDAVLSSEVENTEEKAASRTACACSILHQADQSLRKCVTEAVTTAKDKGLLSRAGLRALGSQVNTARLAVLQRLRDGEVRPPPLVAMPTDDPGRETDSPDRGRDFDAFIRDLFEGERQAR